MPRQLESSSLFNDGLFYWPHSAYAQYDSITAAADSANYSALPQSPWPIGSSTSQSMGNSSGLLTGVNRQHMSLAEANRNSANGPNASENHQPPMLSTSYQPNTFLHSPSKHPVTQAAETSAHERVFNAAINLGAVNLSSMPPLSTVLSGRNPHHQSRDFQHPPQYFQNSTALQGHVPISPAWLERPPAPGDAGWMHIGPVETAGKTDRHENCNKRKFSILADEDSQQSDGAEGSARHAANIRERRRMRMLNEAFGRLRGHVPQELFSEHKRSKLTVLRGAIRYIKLLSETLIARGGDGKASTTSNSLCQSSRSRRLQQPQSIVIASLSLRHRVSWRITDNAASSIGRLSPRPSASTTSNGGDDSETRTASNSQISPPFQESRLRYVTWTPEKMGLETE